MMATSPDRKRFGDNPPATVIYGDERIPMESRQRGPDVYTTPGQLWNDLYGPAVTIQGDMRWAPLAHTHTVSQISDMTELGRALATAFSPLQARVLIGAQAQVPEATEAEAVAGTVLDMRLWSPRMIAIAAAQHGGGGGGTGLVPMTVAEGIAGVSTAPRSMSAAVLKEIDDARRAGVVTLVRPTLHVDFTRRGLDPRITFTRASEAWEYNAAGVLIPAGSNVWREGYAGGVPQGRAVWQALTNKVTARKHNPTDLSGFSTSHPDDVSISIVDAEVRLKRRGLSAICTNARVYRAECSPSAAGARWVFMTGQVGNTNTHGLSAYARSGNVGSGAPASLRFGYQDSPSTPVAGTEDFERVIAIGAPANTTRVFSFVLWPGSFVEFILPQLIEAPYAGPVIPGDTLAATTRGGDSVFQQLGDWYNPREGTWLVDCGPPQPQTWMMTATRGDGITSGPRVRMTTGASGTRQAIVVDDSNQQSAAVTAGAPGMSGPSIFAYAPGELAATGVGQDFVHAVTTPVGMPSGLTHLAIGHRGDGQSQPNTYFRRLVYWPRRLPNDALLALRDQ